MSPKLSSSLSFELHQQCIGRVVGGRSNHIDSVTVNVKGIGDSWTFISLQSSRFGIKPSRISLMCSKPWLPQSHRIWSDKAYDCLTSPDLVLLFRRLVVLLEQRLRKAAVEWLCLALSALVSCPFCKNASSKHAQSINCAPALTSRAKFVWRDPNRQLQRREVCKFNFIYSI